MSTFRNRLAAALLATALLAGVGLAAPAQAQLRSVEEVQINTTYVDLGFGPTWGNSPSGPALLAWLRSGNLVGPRLVGFLSMSGAPGYCARVRLTYWIGHTEMTAWEESSQSLCTYGSGLVGVPVSAGTHSNIGITRIEVTAMLRRIGAVAWQSQSTVVRYP